MRYDKELYAKHLQGMVRFPTVSNADPEKVDWETFLVMSLGLGDHIQHAGGLVQYHQFRLHQHHPGEGQPLQLPAGKFPGIAPQVLPVDAKLGEEFHKGILLAGDPPEPVGLLYAVP